VTGVPRERRRGERRQGGRRATDESLFGVVGAVDSQSARDSMFGAGWASASADDPDSRFLAREARRIVSTRDSAFTRIERTYVAARAAVGTGLVVAAVTSDLIGSRAPLDSTLLSAAYALQAIVLWLLPGLRSQPSREPVPAYRRRQWLSTIGVDLVAFSALHLLATGSTLNHAALLVLPVLMAGVLTPRLLALGTAAGVTLLLLVVAARLSIGGQDITQPLLQAGLAGLGLFAITLLAGELAGRLAREELAARGSLELARQQAQLNRLVIEEMADGVLVVDRRLRVRAANPAARSLLVAQGQGPVAPFMLADRPAWEALAAAVTEALAERSWPEAGRDVVLAFDGGHSRTVRLRVRFTRRRALDDEDGVEAEQPLVVLLLEDVRTAQARLRQEKLAAMGRVSAGVAHEIRNPLAAIAQANALLLEDELAPTQRRLAAIVADNVERLRRIVDDVLEVAPGVAPQLQHIDATSVVGTAVAEWARTNGVGIGPDRRLRTELPPLPLVVVFDPEHLRRVLVNLLDNARRHADDSAGAMLLRLAAVDDGHAVLSVFSDSAPLPPEVQGHLFEPFFSTRSRGSGLGLYICRELCERYGASIEYRSRPGAERLRNEFAVTMRREAAETSPP
jgi:two-component system sensor histidine kinase PilS (NtrC family)